MKLNFDFLNDRFPVLGNFGELAEKYCYQVFLIILFHYLLWLNSNVLLTVLRDCLPSWMRLRRKRRRRWRVLN